MNKIALVGIQSEGTLAEKARGFLSRADVILASKRLYELFSRDEKFETYRKKCRIINSVDTTVAFLSKTEGRSAVLASGDPLFFGIGTRILDEFPKDDVELYPALASIQLAFSKVKESWENAFFISLHGSKKRDWDIRDVPLLCELYPKLAVLTGGENTPQRIAKGLPAGLKVYVLERLGYRDERIREGAPPRIMRMKFREPNLMLLLSPDTKKPAFGLKEDEFKRTRGLITKDEVRAVVLHKLRLPRKGVFWDIGGGSGSISVEAKRLSPALRVYAIEKEESRIKNIRANAKELSAGAVKALNAEAPDALTGLPEPDRVFIGGSGDKLKGIIRHISKRMQKGIIVLAVVTLESLNEAIPLLESADFRTEVASISVSRAARLKKSYYLRAMNPVFVIRAER